MGAMPENLGQSFDAFVYEYRQYLEQYAAELKAHGYDDATIVQYVKGWHEDFISMMQVSMPPAHFRHN